MPFLKTIPSNRNGLSPLNQRFILTRAPALEYFCQVIQPPSITLANFKTPNPFNMLNEPGTGIDFGQLQLNFMVDENMENWLAIFNWMRGLGFPEAFKQFYDLKQQEPTAGEFSDASVIIFNSAKHARISWEFRDIFPIMLESPVFDTRYDDVVYLTASVTFSIRDFDVRSTEHL